MVKPFPNNELSKKINEICNFFFYQKSISDKPVM